MAPLLVETLSSLPHGVRQILRYRNLNTLAEGHFLKEPYRSYLNEAPERRKKKDLLFEEGSDEFKSFP